MTYFYDEFIEKLATSSHGEYLGYKWLIECDDGTELEYPAEDEILANDVYDTMCHDAEEGGEIKTAITLYKRHEYEGADSEEEYIKSNC